MKFRTDFVTNSSDSSFLTFNIKNNKLFKILEDLGITIESKTEGVFDDFMTVSLPSGESCSIESGDAIFYPLPSEYNSISAWLVGCLLWEVEDVYPAKEEDEYSDFAKELIDLLNNANITDLDWAAVNEWSRADVMRDLNKTFGKYDDELEEAFIEYTNGFEGELGECEAVEVKNGVKVTYAVSDGDDFEEDIEDVKFVIVGKFERFETKEEMKEFIEDLGGIVSSSVSKNTNFVICNEPEETTSKLLDKANELCIPVISEDAFLTKFAPDEFDDLPEYDDYEEDLWAISYNGGIKDMMFSYGVGSVSTEIWKKDKWVSK